MYVIRWFWCLPGKRMLRQREIKVLFTDKLIRVGDVKFLVGDWNRSREFAINESDGQKVLSIRATGFRRNRGTFHIEKIEFEIPIPADQMKDIPAITKRYNRNAGHELHKSKWGWYDRKISPGEDLGNAI